VQLLGVIRASGDQPLLLGALDASDEMVRESAAVALGHWQQNTVIIDALMKRLDDDFFAVRVAAARSLGSLAGDNNERTDAVTSALIKMLDDDFKTVRAASAHALADIGSQRALEVVDGRIDEMEPAVKIAVLRGLAGSDDPRAKQILGRYLDHRDVRYRRAARGEL
jgi:HEAT repeat protein